MLESAAVYVQLLGSPRIRIGQRRVNFLPDKRFQLLAYLAYQGDWVSRERAAFLFWPDTDTQNAKSNLRGLLQRVRALDWLTGLESDAHQLRWSVETDVAQLKGALENGDTEGWLSHYRGPLLPGLEDDDEGEFSDWLGMERGQLHGRWREAVFSRARELENSRQYDGSTQLLRTLIERDPLDEEGLQAYMKVSFQAGNKEQALLAYRTFAKRLQAELGMESTSSTEQLAKEIERAAPIPLPSREGAISAELLPIPSQPSSIMTITKAVRPLPKPATSFVGRDLELTELMHLLSEDCRLLTLTGAGGVGKTRLALQAARELLKSHSDGVYFVPLESLSSAALIPASIATALGLELQGQEEPYTQVIRFLNDKHVLLVLDNFEHLLEGATIASELLQSCSDLKLLVTSRERLNLEEEWLLPIEGLRYPADANNLDQASSYGAVQLFTQRTKRVQPDFVLTRGKLPYVLKVCHLVQGSPLGIELAAAWMRAMPVEEIAQEIGKDYDFLSSTSRNLTDRHRSIRAAFEHSWRLLKPREQAVLGGLSVFQEGFRREAASQIVGATFPVLASLVDKSLLRVTPNGRYDRHPLIYAYAREKLGEPERERLRHLHAHYYLTLAEELDDNLRGAKDAQDLGTMEQEHGNFRAALETLLGQDGDKALRLGLALGRFWEIRGYLHEGSLWLEKALAHHPDGPLTPTIRAKALAVLGRLEQLQGNLPRAESLLEEGLSLWRLIGNPVEVADSLNRLGTVALTKGDYPRAAVHFQEGLDLYRALDDSGGVSALLNNLGELARCQNDFLAASEFYEASLALTSKIDNVRWKAIVLGNLGSARRDLGDFGGAEALLKESLTLKYGVRDEIGLSYCFAGLATISGELGALERAASLLSVVDALTTRTKHQLDLADRNDVARTLARVRSQMDPVDFAAAQDSGWAMSLDEAVAYGLVEQPIRAASSNPDDGTRL